MPTPSEHKTVQTRILEYTQEIGWTLAPREETSPREREKGSGISSPGRPSGKESVRRQSLSEYLRRGFNPVVDVVHDLDVVDVRLAANSPKRQTHLKTPFSYGEWVYEEGALKDD